MTLIAKLAGSIDARRRLRKLELARAVNTQTEASHLLVIAWTFPPLYATSVHSPYSMARDAAQPFDKVTVLCGIDQEGHWPDADASQFALPNNVTVLRADAASLSKTSQKLIKQIDGGIETAIVMAELGIRALVDSPPDTIFVSGPRFSNFAAATLIHQYFNKKPRLFLHYQDEWTVNTPEFIRSTSYDEHWERRAIEAASGLVFVTPGKRDAYINSGLVPYEKPALFCGLGCEPVGAEAAPPNNSQAGLISFVGNSGPQSPLDPFLTCFVEAAQTFPEDLSNISVQITGRQPPETLALMQRLDKVLPGRINVSPPVSPAEATRQMQSSEILLLLANTVNESVIPLKMFDYLALDKNILVYGSTSQSAQIVKQTGAGLVLKENDPAALVDIIRKFDARGSGQTADRRLWRDLNKRALLNHKMIEFMQTGTTTPDHPAQMLELATKREHACLQ